MSGKLIRFKNPKKTDSTRLRFVRLELYEEGSVTGSFEILAPQGEYNFSLSLTDGVEEAVKVLYDDEEGFYVVESEDFAESDNEFLASMLPEAREALRGQLEVWKDLGCSARLALQLRWAEDLLEDLENKYRELSNKLSPRNAAPTLLDLLGEIECLTHFTYGLRTAILCA
jgi:hypothetical protein